MKSRRCRKSAGVEVQRCRGGSDDRECAGDEKKCRSAVKGQVQVKVEVQRRGGRGAVQRRCRGV